MVTLKTGRREVPGLNPSRACAWFCATCLLEFLAYHPMVPVGNIDLPQVPKRHRFVIFSFNCLIFAFPSGILSPIND